MSFSACLESRALAAMALPGLTPSRTYRRRLWRGGRRMAVLAIYIGPHMNDRGWTGRVLIWYPATKRNGVCRPDELETLD